MRLGAGGQGGLVAAAWSRCVVVACLLVLACAAVGFAAGGGDGGVTRLSFAPGYAEAPVVAVDARGDATAAWPSIRLAIQVGSRS
jgi:hypothetical protein